MRCYQGPSRCCKLCLIKIWLLEPFFLSRYDSFMIFFSEIWRKFRFEKRTKFEIANHVVRCGRGTLRSCKSCLRSLLLKCFWFPRYDCFQYFSNMGCWNHFSFWDMPYFMPFLNFSKYFWSKITSKFEILNTMAGCSQGTLRMFSGLQQWLLFLLPFAFLDMTFLSYLKFLFKI